jgi:general stress protein YciG
MKKKAKQLRGFAAMDPEKVKLIASIGGKAQGQQNNPGNFANDPERARIAGRKGGSRSRN